ncbi:MAG: fumarylacetoacetate hydrolase family protein [Chloroflexota bacterium]
MKLGNVSYKGNDRLVAVFDEKTLIDLTALGLPNNMLSLIKMGQDGLVGIHQSIASRSTHHFIPSDAVIWHTPVRRPPKILCIAMNNRSSNSRKIAAPDHPLYFNKASNALVGHQQPIVVYDYYGSVHPEPELAVIIGRRGRQIPAEMADQYVYGYANFNDITGNGMRAEDRVHYYALYASEENPDELERREQHLSYAGRYKGADTFGPMGPYLVTKDEIPDPNNLDVICTWGGEIIAKDSTAFYNYSVQEVIAFLSRFHTLEPGDIISMGTAFKPSPDSKRSLHLADLNRFPREVSMEISGLGKLSNPVEKRS